MRDGALGAEHPGEDPDLVGCPPDPGSADANAPSSSGDPRNDMYPHAHVMRLFEVGIIMRGP